MMADLSDTIEEGIDSMLSSGDFPNFTDIKENSDHSSFTVTTTSMEFDLAVGYSVIVLEIALSLHGGMYNAFNGTPVDNIHVDFINADSREIISSSDSKDM